MKLTFSRNGSAPEAPAPAGYSVLDAQMFVRGDLATDGTIRIDGRLEGSIIRSDIVAGSILTHEGAQIRGKVVVRTVDGAVPMQPELPGSEAATAAATEAASE